MFSSDKIEDITDMMLEMKSENQKEEDLFLNDFSLNLINSDNFEMKLEKNQILQYDLNF